MWVQKRPTLFGERDISDGRMGKERIMTDIHLFPSLKNFTIDDLV
jgi:hypothetical protein